MTERKRAPIPMHKPPVPVFYPLVDENMMNFIREHEGMVRHLYKDTANNITAGIGFNVNNRPKAAYELGMYWNAPESAKSRRATLREIEDAYKRLAPMPFGKEYSAGFYDPSKKGNENLLNIKMRDEAAGRYLQRKLLQSENELRRKIRNFDTIPYTARRALLDMQYNMGDGRFNASKWPEFFKAIDLGDFRKAAEESKRGEVSQERNQAVYNWLVEASRSV